MSRFLIKCLYLEYQAKINSEKIKIQIFIIRILLFPKQYRGNIWVENQRQNKIKIKCVTIEKILKKLIIT